ncbi:caspase domain-containing protein [Annulohypoxylon nitens]|nr:caspase domain-containing protein [Annulohypoxylon nitens]
MGARSTPAQYALLVGIDNYPEYPNHLKSCVNDVCEIAGCLKDTHRRYGSHVTLLAAGNMTDITDISLETIGNPTYNDVTGNLRVVATSVQEGDIVYIHYSGHSTVKTASSTEKFSNDNTGDLAWVLLTDDLSDVDYLWGQDLARCIEQIVNKGAKVTLVLDCCHSGSVVREGVSKDVRYLEYDAKVDQASRARRVGQHAQDNVRRSIEGGDYRDASNLPSWIVNPKGYSIITACLPHQTAKEHTHPQTGRKYGRLSFFLSEAIRDPGIGGLHAEFGKIYRYICTRFRNLHPKQYPMWYGNDSRAFFGGEIDIPTPPFVVFLRPNDSSLNLDGGQAHGICVSDQFDIRASGRREPVYSGTVDRVGPLVSHLVVDQPALYDINLTLEAKARTWFSLRQFAIRLDCKLSSVDEWDDIQNRRPWLFFNDSGPFEFRVQPSTSGSGYQIYGRSGQLIDNMNHALLQSPQDCVKALEHLAKFKLVKEFSNPPTAPMSIPAEEFRVSLVSPTKSGEEYYPGNIVDVLEGDELFVKVENRSLNSVMYVHIYNLTPQWSIQNFLSGSGQAIYPNGYSRGTFTTGTSIKTERFSTQVPDEMVDRGCYCCEDIIKVIITKRTTSFETLRLPTIDQTLKQEDETQIGEDQDRGDKKYIESENWTTVEFHIRTSVPDEAETA